MNRGHATAFPCDFHPAQSFINQPIFQHRLARCNCFILLPTSPPHPPPPSRILHIPGRILAKQGRALTRIKSRVEEFFELAQRQWLQRAHAERAAIAGSRARL